MVQSELDGRWVFALAGQPRRLSLHELFWRDPVDFFFDSGFVEEAATLQDRFAVGDHVGVAA